MVEVETAADVGRRLAASARRVTTSASCGLCGRQTIDSLRAEAPRVDGGWTLPSDIVTSLTDRLRVAQPAFAESGGLHAAGLFDTAGELKLVAEDIGRHNAVDKVVGSAYLGERLPLRGHLLAVSGRCSFEILQKALAASIPVVAGVSAASSLAIELARESNLTLAGFVRDGSMAVYSGPQRLR